MCPRVARVKGRFGCREVEMSQSRSKARSWVTRGAERWKMGSHPQCIHYGLSCRPPTPAHLPFSDSLAQYRHSGWFMRFPPIFGCLQERGSWRGWGGGGGNVSKNYWQAFLEKVWGKRVSPSLTNKRRATLQRNAAIPLCTLH